MSSKHNIMEKSDYDWKLVKLEDLGTIERGRSRHRPRNDPKLFDGEYPFIQTSDVKVAELHVRDYSQTYNEKGLSQSKLWKPGTLCITIAANIAENAILDIEACFPDSIIGFQPYKEKSDVYFVKYLIDYKQKQMRNVSRGTTQDNLSITKLKSVDFKVPQLKTQKRISVILKFFDNLIENNKRRIEILEEMAETIYREWFVNFNFPGSKNVEVKKVNGEEIPTSWDYTKLGTVLNKLESGKRPKGGIDDSVNDIPSVGASNVLGLGQFNFSDVKYITEEFYENMNTGLVEDRDVLLYKDGAKLGRKSLFQDGFPFKNCSVNSHVLLLNTGKICSQYYLFFWLGLSKMQHYIKNVNSSSAQKGINQTNVKNMPFLLPPQKIVDKFHNTAEPLMKEIFNLANRNRILQQARDILLPRLISGEVKPA